MADRNFDELAERFERNLYGNPRGQLRLQLVSEALEKDCAELGSNKTLRVLDAGCGLGQMSLLLARQGHQVTACDLSADLLARAQQRIAQENAAALNNIRFHCCSLQTLDQHAEGTFDLIIFHAVLEWLEQPREGLQQLLRWLRPGGELSLLFYNRHSLIYKNLLRGKFRRIDEQDFRGDPGGLTPINPLLPDEVAHWLAELRIEIVTRRGIRTFYDFMDQTMHPQKPQVAAPEDILRMERKFSTQEPYRGMARYQLWHCRNSQDMGSERIKN